MKRFQTLAAALAAGTCVVAMATPAHAQERQFRVPAGPLKPALDAFVAQSGMQLIYKADELGSVQTNGVQGQMDGSKALARLLEGTGFKSVADSSGARAIVSSAEGNASAVAADDDAAAEQKIAEILVVGQRNQTLNADIKRSEDDPQPYVVLNSEEIRKSGATNIEDFLRQRLSMNTQFGVNNQGPLNTGNSSQIRLRGLPGQTLVLINGRRAAGATISGNEGQPDLNGIPLSAVERIEVLPTTASGIYGGSATGGVVNVILKRDYQGLNVTLGYGNAFAGGAGRFRIDGSGGLSLEDGKTTIFGAASYERTNPLTRGERDFTDRYLADLYDEAPGTLTGASPPTGQTTNIRSTTGANLVLKPAYGGGAVGNIITSVPLGCDVPGSANCAGLVSNAGVYNLLAPHSAQAGGDNFPLLVGTEILALNGSIQRKFGNHVKAFIEASYARNQTRFTINQAVSTYLISGLAVGNPFVQDVRISVPTDSVDGQSKSDFRDLRLTGGVIFDLPYKWRGELDYSWDRTRTQFTGVARVNTAAITADISNGTLNVFRDTNKFPVDLSPYLLPKDVNFPQHGTLQDASLRLGGPILPLPGGDVELNTLFEARKAVRDDNYVYFPSVPLTQFFDDRKQTVLSAYGELRIPVFSAKNAVPFFKELELQLSGRYDDYTSHGAQNVQWFSAPDNPPTPFPTIIHSTNKVHSFDFTAAFKWQPAQDIAFRGSYGTGFLPPSVDQLTTLRVPNGVSFNSVIDPLRGNTPATGDSLNGGSGSLQPEKSKSWSAGLIFTPSFLPGLRVSLDYVSIKKTDNIASFPGGLQAIVNAAAAGDFTERVVRGPNLVGDLPGWAGPIQLVDNTQLNLAKAEVKAWDLQYDYDFATDFGDFQLFAVGTYQPHYTTQILSTNPEIENVGFNGGALKWKGNIGLNWSKDAWNAGWVANYFHSYLIYPADTTASTISFYANNFHGANLKIPSQTYHDVHVGYEFGRGKTGFGNFEVQLVVRNIFNKTPPRESRSYSAFGDPRLARYWLTLSSKF